MSAEDNLNRRQFFHGTNAELKEGDTLQPGPTFDHVYMSSHRYLADTYASNRAVNRGGDPHVYRVQPTGDVSKDNRERWSYKTTSARVVGEV